MVTAPLTRRTLAYSALGLPLIGLAFMAVKSGQVNLFGDTSNYRIVYGRPDGWKTLPHGPQTLFLYRNPKTGVLLRGAVNQVVADVNPTPELDRDGIARYYVDRTHDNMKEWTARMGETVDAKGTSFRLIDRAKKDKEVVTAYAVKGNTTLLVSISGNGTVGKSQVLHTLPEFKGYLASIGMEHTVIDE